MRKSRSIISSKSDLKYVEENVLRDNLKIIMQLIVLFLQTLIEEKRVSNEFERANLRILLHQHRDCVMFDKDWNDGFQGEFV